MEIHRLLSSLQNVLAKRSSSYTISENNSLFIHKEKINIQLVANNGEKPKTTTNKPTLNIINKTHPLNIISRINASFYMKNEKR